MNHRRTASIAICALAAIQLAACADDTTNQTVAATTDSTATQARPDTEVLSDTTVVGPAVTVVESDPAVVADTTVAVPDVTAQLRIVVEEAVQASASIPGLVLHVEAPDRHLDVSVAAGVADRATATPLTPDAGFRIASNTKTFLAAAILRLVEQGTVVLDAPIADLLAPETVDALRAGGYRPDAITLRQLLVHTSGIYDYGTDPAYRAAVNAEPAKRWTRLQQVPSP